MDNGQNSRGDYARRCHRGYRRTEHKVSLPPSQRSRNSSEVDEATGLSTTPSLFVDDRACVVAGLLWPHFGRTATLNAATYCAAVSSISPGQCKNELVEDASTDLYGSEGRGWSSRWLHDGEIISTHE